MPRKKPKLLSRDIIFLAGELKYKLTFGKVLISVVAATVSAFLYTSCVKVDPPQPLVPIPVEVDQSDERVPASFTIDTKAPVGDSVLVAIYNDDRKRYLDSYCIFPYNSKGTYQTMCTKGPKEAVVITGYKASQLNIKEALSYDALKKITVDLRLDDSSAPVCVGTSRFNASNFVEGRVVLEPVMSKITIRNLTFDFSAKPYANIKEIRDLKAYLTNVNALSKLLSDAETNPYEYVNEGALREGDLEDFSSPDMLFKNLAKTFQTGQTSKVGTSLYAYENPVLAASSKPAKATTLVIEGKVDDTTYYWPVSLNLGDFQGDIQGIGRNRSYVLDLHITALGSDSPARAIEAENLSVDFQEVPWNEEYSCVVFDFRDSGEAQPTSLEPFYDVNLFVFNAGGLLEENRYLKKSDLGEKIRLNLLSGCKYSFYFVMNAGYKILAANEKALQDYRFPLSTPGDQIFGMPYATCLKDKLLTGSTVLEVPLERLMGRVNLRIDRSALNSDVNIHVHSAKLCMVAKSAYAFKPNAVRSLDDTFASGYYFSGDKVAVLNNRSFSLSDPLEFYLLENKTDKYLGDDSYGYASYVELKLEYNSFNRYTPAGYYLIYRCYVADENDALNILRGHSYTVTIKPTGDGLSQRRSDPWMMDSSNVKYK